MAVEGGVLVRCQERRDEFLGDLKKGVDPDALVRRHLVLSDPAGLTRQQYVDARERISLETGLHSNCVAVVGSCQAGFSLKKKRKGRFVLFGEDSDVDIALVDRSLYDRIWRAMLESIDDRVEWRRSQECNGFTWAKWQGWIDVKFVNKSFPGIAEAERVKRVFDRATRDLLCGPREVSCRLYSDWYFLESYSRIMVRECVREFVAQQFAKVGDP